MRCMHGSLTMSWLISSFHFRITFISPFSLHRHLDRAHVVCLQMKSTPIGILILLHILSPPSACTYIYQRLDTFMPPLHDPDSAHVRAFTRLVRNPNVAMLSSRISNKATAGQPSAQPLTTTIAAVHPCEHAIVPGA